MGRPARRARRTTVAAASVDSGARDGWARPMRDFMPLEAVASHHHQGRRAPRGGAGPPQLRGAR
eukprot:6090540-Pyramimonas_sp.AAC.1